LLFGPVSHICSSWKPNSCCVASQEKVEEVAEEVEAPASSSGSSRQNTGGGQGWLSGFKLPWQSDQNGSQQVVAFSLNPTQLIWLVNGQIPMNVSLCGVPQPYFLAGLPSTQELVWLPSMKHNQASMGCPGNFNSKEFENAGQGLTHL